MVVVDFVCWLRLWCLLWCVFGLINFVAYLCVCDTELVFLVFRWVSGCLLWMFVFGFEWFGLLVTLDTWCFANFWYGADSGSFWCAVGFG